MPGVRPPQHVQPPTGPSSNFTRRRRNSLPALSSAQLNKLSANAANATKKTKNPGDAKVLSKPDDLPRRPERTSNEKGKAPLHSGNKTLQPVDKGWASRDQHGAQWDHEATHDGNENVGDRTNEETKYAVKNDVSPHTTGNASLVLPNKVQSSKTNAVYIFRFEDDEEKSKESSTTTKPKSPSVPDDSPPSGFNTEPSYPVAELSHTWPFESVEERNSYILLRNAVRFNTTGFCGHKHKQLRESGKLYLTMSPVMELKTPIDDTEYEFEDEWSMSSMIDYSNGSYSPRLSRENNRRLDSLKINANSNLLLKSNPNVKTLSSNLRSALSLSPRRAPSNKNSLTAMKDLSKRKSNRTSRPQSPQRLRETARRSSLDSAVGQIFKNLKSSSSSSVSLPTSNTNTRSRTVPASLASSSSSPSSSVLSSSLPSSSSSLSSSSLSSRLSPPNDHEPKSKPTSPVPLPPRLLARRKSLSALPDLVQAREAEASVLRRGSLTAASSDPMMSSPSAASRTLRKPWRDSANNVNRRGI